MSNKFYSQTTWAYTSVISAQLDDSSIASQQRKIILCNVTWIARDVNI